MLQRQEAGCFENGTQTVKNHDYTSNEGNEAVVIYTFNVNNEMERLLIEPSESMLEAVKETVPKQSYKVDW